MAMFNGNAMFLNSKQKTKAYKEYPRNVRQMFNIAEIQPNGIFKIEPGKGLVMYDRCYVFEDINYINQDDAEREGVLLLLMKWLNSMKTSFKISIANEFRDMNQFLAEIFIAPNKEEYPEIALGMDQWVKNKVEEGSPDTKRVMYLVVTCHAKSFHDAQIYFNTLDTQLHRLFNSWKSKIYRLSAKERLRSLHAFFRMGREDEFDYTNIKGDWRNHILPISYQGYFNYMVMDKLYTSVLVGYQYSASVDEGELIPELSKLPYPSYITLDFAPIKRKILKGKLENAHMNNEKSISDEIEIKRRVGQFASGVSYSKEKRKEELENYQDQVDDNSENAFFIGLLVVVTAESEEQLAQRIEQFKALGDEKGVVLETYNHRQLKALNTALPIGGRQVDHMRSFLTSSAVALQPYYAQDVQESGGTFYGRNRTTHHLIVANRKKLKNPHGMIVGHTGSGKSMLIKETEIAQTVLRCDDDITLLDPQNEFQDIVLGFGGEFFDLTPQSKMRMNPFEVPESVFYGEEKIRNIFIGVQTKFSNAFIASTMENIVVTQEHKSIIGRAIRAMYKEVFHQKHIKQPTLKTLRSNIKLELDKAVNEEDQKLIRKIYNSLEEFTEGAYDMFAYASNINISKRLVAFGLKNVPEDMWEPVMITIMHFLSTRMDYNQKLQKATRLIIDETQVVCKNPSSAAMLLQAVITYRKYGGICTMALQNLTRALENKDLRDMFSNCAYKCFLDQGGVDAQSLRSIQELSNEEFQSLNEDIPGYGVMVWGKKVLLFDAFMEKDNVLYDKFSTNFHEKAEAYQSERNNLEAKAESVKASVDEPQMDYQRQMVLAAASYTPITIQEVELLLGITVEEAKTLLMKMEEEHLLESSDITGIIQYQEVS